MSSNPFDLKFRELAAILFKEWWKIAIVFLLPMAAAVGWSYTIRPYYTATSDLLVESGREFQVRPDPGQAIVSVPYVTKREIINSEIAIMTSTDVIGSVIDEVGLARIYPDMAGRQPGESTADLGIRRFGGDFKALPVEQSNVIRISYSNPNREIAIEVLKVVIELYQRKHAAMYSVQQDAFLDQQTQNYKARLDEINRQLTLLKSANAIFDVSAQRAKLIDERSAVVGLIEQLQNASRAAQAQIAALRSELGPTDPRLAGSGDGGASDALSAKWRMLDLELLAEKFRQQELSSRTTEIEEIDQQLRKIENGARSVDDLEREKRALEDLFRTYRTRFEEARVTNEELEKRNMVSVRVMQQPYAGTEHAGPRRTLFGVAGVVIGLLAAAGMLIYLLVFRESLISAESVERLIGVPVLASVRTQ